MTKKMFLSILLGIAPLGIIYLCCTLYVGVSPVRLMTKDLQRQQWRNKLVSAQGRWLENRVNDYEISVSFVQFPSTWYACLSQTQPATIRVHDGIVVEAEGQDLGACRDVYQQLTVDAIFESVSESIESYDPLKSTLSVQFDPHWGYVAKYRVVYTQGLSGSSFGDGHYQVTVHDFRPLP